MQQLITRLRHSASLKVAVVGFLTLILLIPLSMVRGVVTERSLVNDAARMDIQRAWGYAQTLAGPVLVLPFERAVVSTQGDVYTERSALYVLPQELEITGRLDAEIRYRSIHKVPVYTSDLSISGRFGPVTSDVFSDKYFSPANAARIEPAQTNVLWNEAFIAVGVSDGRAISETPSIRMGDTTIAFVPAGQVIDGLPPQIKAPLADASMQTFAEPVEFDMQLRLNGSESLAVVPMGDTTRVSLRSSWSSPSFSGQYLPNEREVSADGFAASWQVSSLGRQLPSRWEQGSRAADTALGAAFGVELYIPVSTYRSTLRAAKYGVLIIAMTFVVFFLFEFIADLRLHPLQYLMVGLANVTFFLLLISLSEHLGFAVGYALSTLASCGLVVGYSTSILGQRFRGMVVGGVLLALYGFLYMTLNAETYALLAGAVGIWTALGIIMFVTRRVDWYSVSTGNVPGTDAADKQRRFEL